MTNDIKCPHCGAYHCIKWDSYSRDVVHINNEEKKINVQRYKCKICGRTFSKLPEDVFPRKKYSRSAIIQMIEWKYLYGGGLRKVGKTSDRKTIYPSSTIWKYIQWIGPKSKEALEKLKIIFSGVITVDEIYYKCNGGTGVHIVVSAVCEDKNGKYTVIIGSEDFMIELSEESRKDKRKMKKEIREMLSEHIEKVLQDVAERYGVTCIKMVLTDDDPIYSTIVPNIFPFAIHRICLWHILKNFLKALEKLYGNSKIFQKVIPAINSLWHVNNQKKAMEILDKVQSILGSTNKKITRRLAKLRERIIKNRIGLLDFRTNNPSESTFARIKPLIKVIKSFQSEDGMKNYLNSMVMWYNTSVFVDGAHRGKSPIELVCPAGVGDKITPFSYI
ncbi:hypothetical protein MSIBF_A2470006 [groundwater metagenome]|uniref:DUF6431 domain-containing protein n=1 Tax=groundwater metagenome TaxID=717931 RepID=A0A098EAL8_9ZZZZ